MADPTVDMKVSGGQIQGVAGAGSVVIENFTIYNRSVEEMAAADNGGEPIPPCPYPGLAYFGPSDGDLFFGRDVAIAKLAEAVGRQSFTALVGASGSGKSSVVLAGLAPRLHGAGNWRFSHFRIGTELESNPFLALARALTPLYVASDTDVERLKNTKLLATSLAAGELTLRDVFADCRSRNKGQRILLIADQFEEAFTLVKDDAARNRFIDVLLAGFPDPAVGDVADICLILTLRADFYGRALRHRPLADALQGHVENLGPMNREELQAAIVRPAENAGVKFEPGLVETLLDAVQMKPGGLPLLQFALREMWGRLERKTITRKSYDEIGGVEGALAQRAETVFAGLTRNGANPDMDKAFQRLFTRLVTLGEGQVDTRRVVERAELGDEVWGLAQRLAGEENRLVVTNASSARETAEVVHEALIRHWPKLVDWINRDRAFQSWLRQIKSNVELWSANPADEGALLRGGMLAQAREWLARRRDDLSPAEKACIEASIAFRRRAEEEKEAAQQAEIRRQQELTEAAGKLAAEQRGRARIARTFGFAAGAAAVIGIALAGVALYEAREARKNLHLAEEHADLAREQTRLAQRSRAMMLAGLSMKETEAGRAERGLLLALALDPERASRSNFGLLNRDDVPALTVALERAIYAGMDLRRYELGAGGASVSWSTDGRRMVTAATDRTVRIWDAGTGQEVRAFTGFRGLVHSAVFSPDGRRIVTASGDGTARIWDAETGEEVRALDGYRRTIRSAVYDGDGRRIVTASDDWTARIWDAETGLELRKLAGHLGPVYGAAFSADGRRIVTASDDGTARIWDVETGQEVRALNAHHAPVYGAAFSPDGRRIVTASRDQTARIWDVEGGHEVRALTGHQGPVYRAAFSPDGRRIVTVSFDATARIWDAVMTDQEVRALTGHKGRVYSAAFSDNGRRIVTASVDGTARIWDTVTDQEVRVLTGHKGRVYSAAFSADGRRIVTASSDNMARIWDTETGQEVCALNGHQKTVWSAAFSADGRRIVTASDDGTARIWDVETGQEVRALTAHHAPVYGAAFSPDGRRIVTASRDQTARIWDVESGRELRKVTGHEGRVNTAAFSADGRRIVTASHDRTARIWDAETGRELRKLTGRQGPVTSAAFSVDGRRVVTTPGNSNPQVWDVESGQEVRALAGHQKRIWSAAFSGDGRRIVTASSDNTARIWVVLPLSDVWTLAHQRKRRELTEAERKEFYLDE